MTYHDKNTTHKLKVAQRFMELSMLGVTITDSVPNHLLTKNSYNRCSGAGDNINVELGRPDCTDEEWTMDEKNS